MAIAVAAGPTLDQYWEDGPEFTGWGAVVGKYPDGTPAIVQGTFGNGWVVLTGVHPEAPANWRRGMTFTTPASEDNAYAGTLIHARTESSIAIAVLSLTPLGSGPPPRTNKLSSRPEQDNSR